jgi:ribosome maturation factor RimP
MRGDIAAAFERELDAIAHDKAFAGLEIVQHHARLVRGAAQLSVMIDASDGADLALCERLASRINTILGGLNADYSLEVESAGLDRPLVRPKDYERFTGERARIVTSLTVNGGKTHRGILRGLRALVADGCDQVGELGIRRARRSTTRQTTTETTQWQR